MENKGKKRVLFIGIPDMAYVGLDRLLAAGVNIVGVVGPKKTHEMYTPFKTFVLSRGLNLIEYDSLKDEKFINTLKSLDLDIAVVCSFNYKIPKVMLDIPKDGILNTHPSLLPAYRGGNPYSWVIINGEKQSGVTIHFMDEEFDTGDIVAQQVVPIAENATMGTVFNELNLIGADMMVAVLNYYEKQKLPRVSQSQITQSGLNFPLAPNIEGQSLLLNFEKPAVELERFIRAVNPFLIATSVFRDNVVRAFSADVVVDSNAKKYPAGSIVKIEEDRFFIATKENFLVPTTLQFGSFFIGSSKDFINIVKPKVGECFQWKN